ncbi:MAG: SBBP repeat-containing protein [Bacteroidia bacterium]
MKQLFILTFCILSCFCYSQTWTWAKGSHGTGSGDEGYAVAVDGAGNVFATGAFSSSTISFGTYTLTNSGSEDIFLVKYDSNGNVLWAKSAGGTSHDDSYSVCTDTLGNSFITGNFLSPSIVFGTYTLTNTGGSEAFVAKYDPNGNILWVNHSQGNGGDQGRGVGADINGNVLVTGSFSSNNMTFGTATLSNSNTFSSMFVIKFDPNGNAIWAKNPTIGTSFGNSISVDKNGNAFVTGNTLAGDSLLFGPSIITFAAGTQYTFLVKYNSFGNATWAKNSVGASCTGNSVCTDLSGNSLITGYFANAPVSFGMQTLNNTGSNNPFIAKYDSVGNVLWAKTNTGVGGNNQAYSISVDTHGNSFITGGFISTITFGTYTLSQPNPAPDPMFLVNYDQSGNVIYATSLSSGGDDLCGVFTDKKCNTYIAGDFQTINFIVGPNTLTLSTTGGEDIFVAKLAYNCQLEDIAKIENMSSAIYPNPNNGSFNLKFENQIENGQIIIFNSVGQKIHTQKILQGVNNIRIDRISAGLYNYYILQNGRYVGVGKVVVQ